jgi:hypothetical protein
MNGAYWQIEHGCPQCGAPVTMDETDRPLACPFCPTRLYLVAEDHFRYHIPPAAGAEGELLYIPYWRFRGSSFTVSASGWQECTGGSKPSLPPHRPGEALIHWYRERCGKSEEAYSVMKGDFAGGDLSFDDLGENAVW